MPLSREVIHARIDLRIAELRLAAALTAVEYSRAARHAAAAFAQPARPRPLSLPPRDRVDGRRRADVGLVRFVESLGERSIGIAILLQPQLARRPLSRSKASQRPPLLEWRAILSRGIVSTSIIKEGPGGSP
jgi:hypothetical protein